MINKRFIKKALIFLIFIGVALNIALITQFNNPTYRDSYNDLNDDNLKDIKLAQNKIKSLNYSAITRDKEEIYRLFESVEFTVNVSGFDNVKETFMQIDFSNSSRVEYNMSKIVEPDIYSYVYSPKSYAPLGFQNVSFLIYNTSDILTNSHTTYTNFTIKSNYLANLNSSEYNRRDTVYGELIVTDYDVYDFNWNVTVVDTISEASQINLFDIGNNIQQFSFQIDDRFTQPDKIYYIKINMTDNSPPKKVAAYVPFKVLNSAPQIVISSVNFSLEEFKREEDCRIELNVSDADPNARSSYTNVSLILTDPTGEKLSPILLRNNRDWTFDKTFKINANRPIGIYRATLQAKDQYSGRGTYNTTLIINNNPPEIHDFWINGMTIEERISINYGQDILFTFNISDVENSIAYVTVSLLDENNNWYNVSQKYSDTMVINIRSVNLITGVWYVYISATDVDGDTTHLTSDFGFAPKEIRIIPDLLTPIMPWITLIMGLIFGVLAGIAFSYKLVKSKSIDKQQIITKEIAPKKKKVKKPKEELKKEEVEEREPEKETEKKPPQRKIKRKLK